MCVCMLQMWEDLIRKAKIGGLDVIDTYVFWNGHEPSPGNVSVFFSFFRNVIVTSVLLLDLNFFYCLFYRSFTFLFQFHCLFIFQYYFEGRYDLVRFIRTVQKLGLYVHLRIGPYVCAEWNLGYSFFP